MLTLKHVGAAAVAALFALAITADSADARRGGGGGARGGGGFHGGGGMRAGGGGFRGANFGGRAHVSHPIARPGRPGWGGGGNWAGRPGYRPGYGYGGYRPGYGYAVGAAAIGAGLAYGAYSNCEYYGNCGGGYYAEPGYSDAGVSDDGVAYCAQRFRTYDVASQTYIGKGGRRISCP